MDGPEDRVLRERSQWQKDMQFHSHEAGRNIEFIDTA